MSTRKRVILIVLCILLYCVSLSSLRSSWGGDSKSGSDTTTDLWKDQSEIEPSIDCLGAGSEEAEMTFEMQCQTSNDSCNHQDTTTIPGQRTISRIESNSTQFSHPSFLYDDEKISSLTHCSKGAELEIVIAQFSSSVATLHKQLYKLLSGSFMSKKSIVVSVYSKNQDMDIPRYQATLRTLLQKHASSLTVNVYRSPNVGRETLTFIHHILAQWSSLADHTIFVQEDIHSVGSVRDRIEQHLRPNTAFLSLSPFHELCSDRFCTDARANGAEWPAVRSFWTSKNSSEKEEPLLMVYKSQFIMSKTRIQQRQFSDYVRYHQSLSAPSTHEQHVDAKAQDYYHERGYDAKDYWTDPYYGHTIERSWALIAGCNELRIYESCNSFWTAMLLKLTFRSQGEMICGCED